jgi:flagellar hook-associated protein FlgK
MSNRSLVAAETAIPLAPKSNVRSESGDPLDRAGKAILGLLHRAASDAEANNKQAVEMAHQLSAQLRAAEDRIRELEATARHHQDRADRAERWLHQVSVEIEQKFFGRDDGRHSQPPPPQALFRNQRQ